MKRHGLHVMIGIPWAQHVALLIQPFLTSDVVACGGPNGAPPDDPWLARAVALSPRGPIHVMNDDRIAEHVPGCNLAIRRDALLAINGFNPIYLRAGDDADVCWRLQARGGKIGFSAAALVWHHYRPSIRALPFVRSLTNKRIDAGVWGTAGFPSVYRCSAHPVRVLPHSSSWLAASLALLLGGVSIEFGSGWPLTGLLLAVGGGVALLTSKCLDCAFATDDRLLPRIPGRTDAVSRLIVRTVIAWLHFLQALARQVGWFRGRCAPAEDLARSPAPAAALLRLPTAQDYVLALKVLYTGSRSRNGSGGMHRRLVRLCSRGWSSACEACD